MRTHATQSAYRDWSDQKVFSVRHNLKSAILLWNPCAKKAPHALL